MYDIIIIGAGPAGLTAAIYARRAQKSVLLIEKSTFGGQMTFSPKVENYPGILKISGSELADGMVSQAIEQGAVLELDEVVEVALGSAPDYIKTVNAQAASIMTSLIIAWCASQNARRRTRKNSSATEPYCAVRDGAFYKENRLLLLAGNSACEALLYLIHVKKLLSYKTSASTGEVKLHSSYINVII